MGKSHTYKYQIGRSYRIKDLIYDAVFSSTNKEDVKQRARKFKDPIIRKDLGSYALLVPVSPTMTVEISRFRQLLKKYSSNYKKIRG